MRRDAIFYTIFKRSPRLLFELVEQPPANADNYRFESVEVKEPTFRIDGVFLPPPEATPQTIFFAEVQFQRDDLLYHRFFSESLLYLHRNPWVYDDWFGVVIFRSRSLEPQKTNLHRSLINSPQVKRIYLDELGNPEAQPVAISLLQLTIASKAQMVTQAKQLIERVEAEETSPLPKDDIIDVITTIAVYKLTNLSRVEVEAMLGIDLEQTRVYQEAKAEGRQEGIQEGRQEGIQEGRQEGIQEGREALQSELVRRMLARGMSQQEVAELLGITLKQLRQIAQEQA